MSKKSFVKSNSGVIIMSYVLSSALLVLVAIALPYAPSQANFAKYCQDYSEIQSAVSTQGALIYGELAIARYKVTPENFRMSNVYKYICTTSKVTHEQAKASGNVIMPTVTNGERVTIDAENNMLGFEEFPNYITWMVDVETGTLYSSGFEYEGYIYTTPNSYTPIQK